MTRGPNGALRGTAAAATPDPQPRRTLPEGTVTFLFTDLEGSTRLLQAHPAAYREAVRRHHELLAAAVEGHGGVVFETVGDAVYAAFERPADAVKTALEGQLALRREAWGAVGELRARMGVHAGAVERQGAHYFGVPLYRCARLTAAAHGGQVVLSEAAAALVRDALPEGAALRDLGPHRLKDLAQPERVAQLLHPELPAAFPPLRSLDARPHNLPVQVTSFVGREAEVAEVRRRLGTARLLTLTGAGGCGKTRLALQAAADLVDADGAPYPDGVWFVDLAPLTDPTLVPQAVAAAVGVREEPGRPLLATLADALRPQRVLLVLDNCEHLLDACAQLADALLRACPQVRLLATSRQVLGLAGEVPWRVPSLALPDPRPRPAAALSQYEAVRLFVERAGAVQPAFTVTNANAPAVAQLCWRLDGIPLALELAAARLRVLTVEQVLERLEDRFRLLTGGSRTALPRQQTLRAAVDWSYALLGEPERRLFARLAVFAGGWTLEAAEAVCAGGALAAGDVLDLLTGLVEKSLAVVEVGEGGAGGAAGPAAAARYRLLETLRQYGRERLEERGEAEALRRAHAGYYLALAERAAPELRRAQQVAWFDRLEREHDNLRAALRWALDRGEAERGLRLGAALMPFWFRRGHWAEGRGWLEALLAAPAAARRTPARAGALSAAGQLLLFQGDLAASRRLREEALAIYRERGDRLRAVSALRTLGYVSLHLADYGGARRQYAEALAAVRALGSRPEAAAGPDAVWIRRETAFALGGLGMVACVRGDYAAARALGEQSLALFRALGASDDTAAALTELASTALAQGDHAAGLGLLAEARPLWQAVGDRSGGAWLLELAGDVARARGDLPRAAALYEESLATWRELGSRQHAALLLRQLGQVATRQDAPERATALLRTSLAELLEVGDRAGIALCLVGLAAAAERRPIRAARLLGAAEARCEALGLRLWAVERDEWARTTARARAQLGEAAFAAAWTAGQALPLEQAVAYALEDAPAAA
jgi:predicted ATPase/class 3 adenylate cyclase